MESGDGIKEAPGPRQAETEVLEEEGDEEAMNGAGGAGFVIDTATLFLFLVGIVVLGGVWWWLRRKAAKQR